MRISYQGRPYLLKYSALSGPRLLGEGIRKQFTNPVDPERTGELIRDGALFEDDGTPITGPRAKRIRARLLGTYAHMPHPGDRTMRARFEERKARKRRMLIPGLWPWGTMPMLGGNAKAGKSTITADLAAALVVPGYRFLGHFGPADMDEEEKRPREVVVINAETPLEDFEAPLAWLYDYDGCDWDDDAHPVGRIRFEHLEEDLGASSFDVTDPDLYDWWSNYLVSYDEDDPTIERAPMAVIVDGVTAILGNNTSRYGEWYAKFRELMRDCGVPNALAVAHNTMSGGHLMGGVESQAGPDGLWRYSSDDSDNPNAVRRFSVHARMGGVTIPPTRVVLSEDGRPVMEGGPESAAPSARGRAAAVRETPDPRQEEEADAVVAYVQAHPGADGAQITANAPLPSKVMILRGRHAAVEQGRISGQKCGEGCTVCEKPHAQRTHFWPVIEPEPEPDPDPEGVVEMDLGAVTPDPGFPGSEPGFDREPGSLPVE